MIEKEYFWTIREKINWSAVLRKLGLKIGLKSGGQKSLGTMKCPFHDEKHSSMVFYVTGWFYCFGCGKGGDIFHFIQSKLGLTVMQTCHFFKKQFGIPLPTFKKINPPE